MIILFGLQDYFNERIYLTEIQQKIDYLPISQWQSTLQKVQHIAFTDSPLQQIAPLVLQFNCLYFYRVWQDEFRIADYFKSAVCFEPVFSTEQLSQIASILDRYFQEEQGIDWQKIAVAMALRQRFCFNYRWAGNGENNNRNQVAFNLARTASK